MYLHVSTVCGIVDRLEGAGHLVRSRNDKDRRAINICLTEKGVRTVKDAPLSGFANMFHDLQKMPASEVKKISRAMVYLSKIMNIEINEMRHIS
jgi:DNA-binding MarR family transcriptional regulator